MILENPNIKQGGHIEVFQDDERSGTKILIHSSRPDEILRASCQLCGFPLGFKRLVVAYRSGNAHQDCVERRRRG